MYVNNPIRPKHFDYHAYEAQIDAYFRETMRDTAGMTHGVNLEKPRRRFWEMVDGARVEDDLYTRLAIMGAYEVNQNILRTEGRLSDAYYQMEHSWHEYLLERVFSPNLFAFPPEYLNDFLEGNVIDELAELGNTPRKPGAGDRPALFDLAEFQRLVTDVTDLGEFWPLFERHFRIFWTAFERFTLYVGEPIGDATGEVVDTVRATYQVRAPGESPGPRTPVGYPFNLNSFFQTLLHLRNSVLDRSYQFDNAQAPTKVLLEDVDPATYETTFSTECSLGMLRQVLQILLILIVGLQRAVLTAYVTRVIKVQVAQHTREVTCPWCGHRAEYVLTPNKRAVKCKQCARKIRFGRPAERDESPP